MIAVIHFNSEKEPPIRTQGGLIRTQIRTLVTQGELKDGQADQLAHFLGVIHWSHGRTRRYDDRPSKRGGPRSRGRSRESRATQSHSPQWCQRTSAPLNSIGVHRDGGICLPPRWARLFSLKPTVFKEKTKPCLN
jgi:hypothetical protein